MQEARVSIRIQSVGTRIVDHALRPERIIVSHAGRHDRSRFLEVTLHGPAGMRGYGEAAVTALWSGETAETAQWTIEHLFAPALVGCGFAHPREALAALDAVAYGLPFTKSAVDTACWDLWARLQERSVLGLIGDRTPPVSIPTRASVGAYPVEQTVRLACEFWAAGIQTLKFKTGMPGLDDAARLRAVRERLGNEPRFTVDANGAYRDAETAVRAIEALLPFQLALVEQPTHRDRIGLLAQVRKRVPVPILADECVFTPVQLEEALDLEAFDVLSVYPGKNGGFTRSLEMARTAQQAGKRCAIGSNLESELGQAAMTCLAAGLTAFPVEELACDLQAALMYERSSVTPAGTLRAGRASVPSGLGFGVEPRA